MAKNVISNIWGQNAINRQIFSEDEIAQGIEYKGPVVSPQLNGIAFDLYTYVDNLQRANAAWNPLKNYAVGDTANVRVLYNNSHLDMNFACISSGQSQPLAQKDFATAFTVDSSNQVAVFIITDDGKHRITEYVGENWVYLQNAGAFEVNRDLLAEVARAKTKEEELQENLSVYVGFVYPVGSIFTTLNADFDPNVTFVGTSWEKIKSGLFLEATEDSDEVGNEMEPGLPNITAWSQFFHFPVTWTYGSFVGGNYGPAVGGGGYEGRRFMAEISLDASVSSAVYGRSEVVQPASIRCFMWKRVS